MRKRLDARGFFISGTILALVFGVALCLRVCLPYDTVFSGDWIKFTGADAYYHMRLVDNLALNFPHLLSFDPYFIYPGGSGVGDIHFFDRLLAGIIWLIGLGSPTQHTIDVVSVYFPAVLGALTVIPVYFIGKELFNRWVGVFSAGLLAVLPGEFLGRSILGFADHHVAETLFTSVAMLFLILAIKAARQRQLDFSHLWHRNRAVITRPIIYSLLAGICLGIYLHTWMGALLFIFIIALYFVIQFIIDHLKHESTDYLCLVGVILFLTVAIMFLPFYLDEFYLASMVIAFLIPLVSNGVSRLMASRQIKPAYYPLAVVGLGLAGLGLFHLIRPALLSTMLSKFPMIFTPGGVQLATTEMQHLLFPGGNFSLAVAWDNFAISFFLSVISLGMLVYLVVRQEGSAGRSLLVVWSLVILAATLGQVRFGYYFAVNVALLTGYLSWRILSLAGFKELSTRAATISKKAGRKKARTKKSGFRVPVSQMALATLIIFCIVAFPNIKPAITNANRVQFAPSDAWCSSLSWLKQNTPDPFGNPALYYQLGGGDKPAYSVMSWWDYGYWISRIAHRVPYTNPSQGRIPTTATASFFLSQDEGSAQPLIYKSDSRYIIIDYQTACVDPKTAVSKFGAIIIWAGREQAEFLDIYYRPQAGHLVPVLLFYPEYYRSLSTRLYNFDGKAVVPESILVISYQEEVSGEGIPYKEITGEEEFDSYEKAEAYLLSQESANCKIVGTDPLLSPVPLEALEHYRLIHSSGEGLTHPEVGMVPEVKIFEYTGDL